MLVSTIIPVFNRAAMLREAVASVIAQTHRPIEIVIVDDGSTDETGAVADELATAIPTQGAPASSRPFRRLPGGRQDAGGTAGKMPALQEPTRDAVPQLGMTVVVLHQPNAGPGAAREAGRQAARGDFVQYLDSDDLLLPRKFELQVAGLREHPECGASYGWTRIRFPDGSTNDRPWKGTGEKHEAMFPAFLESRWWDTSTPLFRREVTVPWSDLRVEEDWEHDARIASHGTRLHFVEEWVSETRQLDPRRLSQIRNSAVLRDRARAHALIYGHARKAGIREGKELEHFARELFLLARQCGAAGLAAESEMLFGLAREAAGERANAMQFRAYEAAARILGWPLTGKIACLSDRLRW